MVLCQIKYNFKSQFVNYVYCYRTSALQNMYAVSYMWYAVIGTITCVTVGNIIGLITGNENDAFDERLLHPLIAKICRKLPGRKRTFTTNTEKNTNVDETVISKETSEKTDVTVVEEQDESVKQTYFVATGSRLFDVYDVRKSPTPSTLRTRL